MNTLLDVFDKIISGEISHTGESPADITLFENPEVANKFNEVVETYKRFNNNFVMRLNEAMATLMWLIDSSRLCPDSPIAPIA